MLFELFSGKDYIFIDSTSGVTWYFVYICEVLWSVIGWKKEGYSNNCVQIMYLILLKYQTKKIVSMICWDCVNSVHDWLVLSHIQQTKNEQPAYNTSHWWPCEWERKLCGLMAIHMAESWLSVSISSSFTKTNREQT